MRPHGKYAKVDPAYPRAFAQCDRCSFWFNHDDLQWQYEWAGTSLMNIRVLVCRRCLDKPQEQFRTIILPPDPPPIINARPPNFLYEEYTVRIAEYSAADLPNMPPWDFGPQLIRCLADGVTSRVLSWAGYAKEPADFFILNQDQLAGQDVLGSNLSLILDEGLFELDISLFDGPDVLGAPSGTPGGETELPGIITLDKSLLDGFDVFG